MKYLKTLIGLLCLLVMGFIGCVLCAGLGMLIAFTFVVFPIWQIAIGTILGSIGVYLHLIGK